MNFLKKILFVVLFIISTILFTILLAIINFAFKLHLSGGEIFFFSLLLGWITGYVGRRFAGVILIKRLQKFMPGNLPAQKRNRVITEDIPYTDV
jgi:hypothetical protein